MKSQVYALMFLLIAGVASATTNTIARVQVTWAPDAQLSEVKDNPMQRGWLRPKDWEKSLAEYLMQRADSLLPPGQQLQVTIDDVKLAGSFEPWRVRPNLEDARILKDIYPPRMDLHYKLLAADGSTIREGNGKLRDMAYLQRAMTASTDPLRYDKRMIGDWLRREFPHNPE
jgi:hypothetical protein